MQKAKPFILGLLLVVGLLLGMSEMMEVSSAETHPTTVETTLPNTIPEYDWFQSYTLSLERKLIDQWTVSETEYHLLFEEEGDLIHEHFKNGKSSTTVFSEISVMRTFSWTVFF